MDYVNLGATGLKVSRLCLGCMNFGVAEKGFHAWAMPLDDARPFFRQAFEAGINFFDTANVYSAGTSEEITGTLIAEHARRDEVVIATKVWGTMRKGDPNGRGLSRKAIMTEIDHSLRRLGTDYVDLYQIHRLDPDTPLEETLEALHDVVRAGKARYIGASSMFAWEFAKALFTQRLEGWARFVSMQDHYNLLNREEEREMFGLCADQGIGVIPWSPLARGKVARPFDETTERAETDTFGKKMYLEDNRPIVNAVEQVAGERGVPMASVALAWVLRNPVVTAPIIGVSKERHLTDALGALDLALSDDEALRLEAGYTPRENRGFGPERY